MPPIKDISFQDSVSRRFRQQVSSGYSSIPADERNYLQNQGVTFKVPTVAEYRKTNSNGIVDSRSNLCEAGAWFDPYTNQVVVNENVVDIKTGKVKPTNVNDAHETIRHEFGHSFSANAYARSDLSKGFSIGPWRFVSAEAGQYQNASQTESFKRAYAADLAALGGADSAIEKGYGYYVAHGGHGDQGREEVFAEQWADKHGGGLRPNLSRDFPNTRRWMDDFVEGHKAVRAQGPQAVREFFREFGVTGQLKKPVAVEYSRSPARAALERGAGDIANYQVATLGDGQDVFRTRPGAFTEPQLVAMANAVNKIPGQHAYVTESVSSPGKYYMALDIANKKVHTAHIPGMIEDAVRSSLSQPARDKSRMQSNRGRNEYAIAAKPPDEAVARLNSDAGIQVASGGTQAAATSPTPSGPDAANTSSMKMGHTDNIDQGGLAVNPVHNQQPAVPQLQSGQTSVVGQTSTPAANDVSVQPPAQPQLQQGQTSNVGQNRPAAANEMHPDKPVKPLNEVGKAGKIMGPAMLFAGPVIEAASAAIKEYKDGKGAASIAGAAAVGVGKGVVDTFAPGARDGYSDVIGNKDLTPVDRMLNAAAHATGMATAAGGAAIVVEAAGVVTLPAAVPTAVATGVAGTANLAINLAKAGLKISGLAGKDQDGGYIYNGVAVSWATMSAAIEKTIPAAAMQTNMRFLLTQENILKDAGLGDKDKNGKTAADYLRDPQTRDAYLGALKEAVAGEKDPAIRAKKESMVEAAEQFAEIEQRRAAKLQPYMKDLEEKLASTLKVQQLASQFKQENKSNEATHAPIVAAQINHGLNSQPPVTKESRLPN